MTPPERDDDMAWIVVGMAAFVLGVGAGLWLGAAWLR